MVDYKTNVSDEKQKQDHKFWEGRRPKLSQRVYISRRRKVGHLACQTGNKIMLIIRIQLIWVNELWLFEQEWKSDRSWWCLVEPNETFWGPRIHSHRQPFRGGKKGSTKFMSLTERNDVPLCLVCFLICKQLSDLHMTWVNINFCCYCCSSSVPCLSRSSLPPYFPSIPNLKSPNLTDLFAQRLFSVRYSVCYIWHIIFGAGYLSVAGTTTMKAMKACQNKYTAEGRRRRRKYSLN